MMAFRILEPGPLATIQDLGRFGYLDRGIPVSGAVDLFAHRIGNIIVGNRDSDASVEITFGGFVAEFLMDLCFCVSGAGMKAVLNDIPVPFWKSRIAKKGDVLSLHFTGEGSRSYLTVAGGIDVPAVMGSRSTYIRGAFGGLSGRALRKGDIICVGKQLSSPVPSCPACLIPDYSIDPVVRVVLGPQDDCFTMDSKKTFLRDSYKLTSHSDRMGCLLEGPPICHTMGADIISDGTVAGSVQIPGNGQPTILLADCQTVGGYAKIATVTSLDLPIVAQLLPGATLRFNAISLLEAREIYLKKEFMIRKFSKGY